LGCPAKSRLGYMRTEIAKRIRLRFAPELVLAKDTSHWNTAPILTVC
jgi:ribosome-binding factor A